MRQIDESQLTQADLTARQIPDPVGRLRYLQSVASAPPSVSRWKSRITIGFLTLVVLGMVAAPLSLRMPGAAHAASRKPPSQPALPQILRVEPEVAPSADVWSVEKASDFETYSNGLRIENQYAVRHRPRAYVAYSIADPEATGGQKRSDPAGIVYHTTESLQAPFEPSQNNLLKRVGESLIDYVRRRQCYNFLIDRFGRVFRIVNESDAADHAGHSVWADDRYFYVNLNDSFIGISFEAQTGDGETSTRVGDAQVRAAAMLTEMLRNRYKIPGGNCVTHAQVSVNPSNMQIGYHVDWASSFPFEKLGLPDNYATPSPAVSLFGFSFDASFAQRAGERLALGASNADRGLVQRAQTEHLSLTAYRKMLHRRYLKITARHRG
jgi:N-acetylmuramoyl-L-alanine amidase